MLILIIDIVCMVFAALPIGSLFESNYHSRGAVLYIEENPTVLDNLFK